MNRRDWLGWMAGGLALGWASQGFAAPRRFRAHQEMQVQAVGLPAWVVRAGKREPLAPGERVSTAQSVETGADGGVVFLLPDGARIFLGEKTSLSVLEWQASSQQGEVALKARLGLSNGLFRYTADSLAKIRGARDLKLELRSVNLGIRGTDFWSMTDAEHDAACLFEGAIVLDTRDQGRLELTRPTAFWARFFNKPVQPVGNATPVQLEKFLASTELKVGKGVAVVDGRWRVVAAQLSNEAGARELQLKLRAAGYPATVKLRGNKFEVRIDGLATRPDAESVLSRLGGIQGVDGRVALSA